MQPQLEPTESTKAEPGARPPLPPGKKWVKVRRTKTYVDKDGYMVNSDYDSYEEADDVPEKPKGVKSVPPKPVATAAAKTGPKK